MRPIGCDLDDGAPADEGADLLRRLALLPSGRREAAVHAIDAILTVLGAPMPTRGASGRRSAPDETR